MTIIKASNISNNNKTILQNNNSSWLFKKTLTWLRRI